MDITLDGLLLSNAEGCGNSQNGCAIDPLASGFAEDGHTDQQFNASDASNDPASVDDMWTSSFAERESAFQFEEVMEGEERFDAIDWGSMSVTVADQADPLTKIDFDSVVFDESTIPGLSSSQSSCPGEDDFLSELIVNDCQTRDLELELVMQENRYPSANNTNHGNAKLTTPSTFSSSRAKTTAKDAKDDSSKIPSTKPRDKSTQRKLRNKESARRYREKQVAKRRQLEDFTRTLAEQNRELESLHEKLLSLTCRQPGSFRESEGMCAPLQNINQ